MKKTKVFVSCLLVLLLLPLFICAEGAAGDRPPRPTPAPHTHNFVDWYVESQAACTEPGMTRAHCSICGARASQAIPPLGHDWGEWQEKGAYLERACGRCGMTQQKPLNGEHSDGLLLTGRQDGNSVTLSVTNTGTSAAADVSIALTVTDEEGAVLYSSSIAPEDGAMLESGSTVTVTTDLPDNPNADEEGEGHGTLPATASFLAAGTSAKTGGAVTSDPWNADLNVWKVLPAAMGPDASFELVVDKIVYNRPEVEGNIYVSIYVRNAGTEDMKLTDADFTWESARGSYLPVKTVHFDKGAFAPGETNEIAIGYGTVLPKDRDTGYIDLHFDITGCYAGSESMYSGVVRKLSEDLRVYIPNPTLSQWDKIFALPFNTDLEVSLSCGVSVYEEGQDVPLYLSVRNAGKKTIYAASTCGFKYDPMPLSYPSGEPFLAYRFYPGDVVNKTFHYTVTAKDIKAGEFSFMFYAYGIAEGSDGYARSDRAMVTLKVKPTASISLLPVSADEANFAGQKVGVELLVTNTGNDELADVTVSPVFSNASYSPVSADPAPFTLPPHESRHVYFSLTVLDEDLDIAEGIILRFKAEGTPSHGGDNVSEKCQVLIDNYRKDPPVPDEPAPAPHDDPAVVLKDPSASDAVRFAGQQITVGVTAENPNAYGLSSVYVECAHPDTGILPAKDYGASELGAGKEDTYTFVYTVTEDDLAKPYVTVAYSVSAEDDETGLSCSAKLETWIPSEVEGKTPEPEPDGTPKLQLVSPFASSPANYAGQEIVAGVTVKNPNTGAAKTVNASCSQQDTSALLPLKSEGAHELPGGGQDDWTFLYTVLPEDMSKTEIHLRFSADGIDADTGKYLSDSIELTVPVVPIGIEDDKTELSIDLIDLKAGDFAQYEGQVITVSARAYNPNPVSLKNVDVRAEDSATHTPLPVNTSGSAYLTTHADTEYSFDYTVTKEDMAGPSLTIVFEAFGEEDGGDTDETVYDADTLTIDVVPLATTKEASPAVLVEKSVTNHAKAKDGRFEPFETIDFNIRITNNMPYDVAAFTVFDILAPGTGYWTTVGPVPSGGSVDVYFPYAPDTAECGGDFLYNQATVQWADPDTGETKTAVSNVVKADLYVPNGASAGGSCCVRTLVSAEGGTLVWRTDCCPAHAKLTEAGTGAEAAWLEAAKALYDGMLAGADGETASAIRAERDAWLARHEALGDLLALIVPDAEAALRILTEDAMLRCTDLCCEAHTAPSPRADLADPSAYAAGGRGSCSLVTETDDEGFTLTLGVCASHGEANDLNALQKEAGDRVRLLQFALAGGDRSRVNALRSAQADWFAARGALLNVLYGADAADAILAADARICIAQICAASSEP